MAELLSTWGLGQVAPVCKSWWDSERVWISRSEFWERSKAIHLQDIAFIYFRWGYGLPSIQQLCSWHQGTQEWGLDASPASSCASSQWLCLWGSVFAQCIFGLPCHSHINTINRTPWFNCFHEAQIFIMQTPVSSGYYWKVQRKWVTEEEYK